MFYEEIKCLFIISMSAYNLPNYKSFEQFNGGSYTNDEYVTKNYLGGSSVSIANTASSTTNIGDSLYANSATTTIVPTGSRVINNAPVQLPAPFSSNWTNNVPLIMSAYMNLASGTVTATGAGAGTTTFHFYKLGAMVMFTFDDWSHLATATASTYTFDFSGYPEILPRMTTEIFIRILVNTTTFDTLLQFNADGNLQFRRDKALGANFNATITSQFYSATMMYLCNTDAFGY